jgi:hypothetical protein
MGLHQPTIGRIVHYVNGSAHRPAIVVDEPLAATPVLLAVFDEPAVWYVHAALDETGEYPDGTWHWPEGR